MQLSFKALEAAFSKIEELGKGEETFEVGGTTLTITSLSPEKTLEAQRYASVAFENQEGEGEDSSSVITMSYLYRFKLATLAYAIIQIDDLNLRGQEFVETDEQLANGQHVKFPKFDAVIKLMSMWNDSILTRVFAKYTEMARKIERSAENLVQLDPVDYDAEIERLRDRLRELEKEREQKDQELKSAYLEHLEKVNNPLTVKSSSNQEPEPDPTPPPQAHAQAVPQEESTPQPRQPVTPHMAPPPAASPQPRQPSIASSPPVVPDQEEPVDLLPQYQDSMVGADEDLDVAVARENARLAALRQRRVPVPPQGHPTPVRRRDVAPPHQAAQQVDVELGVTEAALQYAASPDNRPAEYFDLSPSASPAPAQAQPQQAGAPSRNRNPRFTPPKR